MQTFIILTYILSILNGLISQFDKLKSALEKIDSTAFQQSVNISSGAVLTSDMSAVAYEVAKKVYEGIFGRSEGKVEIVRLTGNECRIGRRLYF